MGGKKGGRGKCKKVGGNNGTGSMWSFVFTVQDRDPESDVGQGGEREGGNCSLRLRFFSGEGKFPSGNINFWQ